MYVHDEDDASDTESVDEIQNYGKINGSKYGEAGISNMPDSVKMLDNSFLTNNILQIYDNDVGIKSLDSNTLEIGKYDATINLHTSEPSSDTLNSLNNGMDSPFSNASDINANLKSAQRLNNNVHDTTSGFDLFDLLPESQQAGRTSFQYTLSNSKTSHGSNNRPVESHTTIERSPVGDSLVQKSGDYDVVAISEPSQSGKSESKLPDWFQASPVNEPMFIRTNIIQDIHADSILSAENTKDVRNLDGADSLRQSLPNVDSFENSVVPSIGELTASHDSKKLLEQTNQSDGLKAYSGDNNYSDIFQSNTGQDSHQSNVGQDGLHSNMGQDGLQSNIGQDGHQNNMGLDGHHSIMGQDGLQSNGGLAASDNDLNDEIPATSGKNLPSWFTPVGESNAHNSLSNMDVEESKSEMLVKNHADMAAESRNNKFNVLEDGFDMKPFIPDNDRLKESDITLDFSSKEDANDFISSAHDVNDGLHLFDQHLGSDFYSSKKPLPESGKHQMSDSTDSRLKEFSVPNNHDFEDNNSTLIMESGGIKKNEGKPMEHFQPNFEKHFKNDANIYNVRSDEGVGDFVMIDGTQNDSIFGDSSILQTSAPFSIKPGDMFVDTDDIMLDEVSFDTEKSSNFAAERIRNDQHIGMPGMYENRGEADAWGRLEGNQKWNQADIEKNKGNLDGLHGIMAAAASEVVRHGHSEPDQLLADNKIVSQGDAWEIIPNFDQPRSVDADFDINIIEPSVSDAAKSFTSSDAPERIKSAEHISADTSTNVIMAPVRHHKEKKIEKLEEIKPDQNKIQADLDGFMSQKDILEEQDIAFELEDRGVQVTNKYKIEDPPSITAVEAALRQRLTVEDEPNEWDDLPNVTPGFGSETAVRPRVADITYQEALAYLRTKSLVERYRAQVSTTVPKTGLAKYLFCFGPAKLQSALEPDRDLLFCIAACPLENDEVHMRVLQCIYRRLTGATLDCPRYGSHWDQIGFQGSDPATDLRSTGFLSLLLMLNLTTNNRTLDLAQKTYRLSLHERQNFPFAVVSINLTNICIQVMRAGLLNKLCNKRHDVFDVFCDFYFGTFLRFYTVWHDQNKTIVDSGFVMSELEVYVKKHVGDVVKSTYSSQQNSSSRSAAESSASHRSPAAAGFTNLDDVSDVLV